MRQERLLILTPYGEFEIPPIHCKTLHNFSILTLRINDSGLFVWNGQTALYDSFYLT